MSKLSNDYKQLIFIYNADSGLINALLDYGKKYIQPDKYECQLCAVTYGPFGMKNDWKKFFKQLHTDVEFLHRDEYVAAHPDSTIDQYPTMLGIDNAGEHKILISKTDFEKIKSLEDLKTTITHL